MSSQFLVELFQRKTWRSLHFSKHVNQMKETSGDHFNEKHYLFKVIKKR